MKTTLAGAAALAMLAAALGAGPDAAAQTAVSPRTGATTGQAPSGLQQPPSAATPRTAHRSAHRSARQAKRTHRQQAAGARPTDPRDRAYMDGGMVGGTSSSGGLSPGAGGTTGQGTSGMQQSPMGGGMNMGAPMGGGAAGRMGTGPGSADGVGSGNQPGTGGTSQSR